MSEGQDAAHSQREGSSTREPSQHSTTEAAQSHGSAPGKSTRTGLFAAPPTDGHERVAAQREALEQAQRALALLERETARLEAAFFIRDFAATRASADASRALQRSLRGSLARARAAGADGIEPARVSRRADELDQRLLPVLRHAPSMPSDLGIDLTDPMADAAQEKAWRASLEGRSPQGISASPTTAPPKIADVADATGPINEALAGSLPDGVDYQWIPDTFRLRVRKAWVLGGLTGPLGRSAIPPVRLRELLRHLRAVGALHWASDAAIERTAEELSIHSLGHGKIFELELPVHAFRHLGLPPGVATVIDLDGAGGLVAVMRLATPAPPAAESVQLSAAQRRQLVRAIEDFFDVAMDEPSRRTFVDKTDVSCLLRSGAISLRFSPADLAWLFSEPMYLALLEERAPGAGSWKQFAATAPGPRQRSQRPAGRKQPAASDSTPPAASAASSDVSEPDAAPHDAASAQQPTATTKPSTPPQPSTADLSAEETATVHAWMAEHLSADSADSASSASSAKAPGASPPSAAPSRYLLEQLRAVEAHPQRELILARLRATAGAAPSTSAAPLTGRALEELIVWAEHEAARLLAGLDAKPLAPSIDAGVDARPPVFDFPIPATLLHTATTEAAPAGAATGHATAVALAGEELRFWLHVEWPQQMSSEQKSDHVFRERIAECEWVFQRASDAVAGGGGGPGARLVARSRGKEPAHRQRFELDPGSGAVEETWTLQAFVRHSYFRPTRLALTFQVRSERHHLQEQQREQFADLGGVSASRSNSFGHGTYDAGRRLTGELPADFQRRTPEQRRQQLEQELARLTELRGYLVKQADQADAVAACDRQLAALRDTLAELADDARSGWLPFEARAFFVGKGDHGLDGPLELAGATKRVASTAGLPAVSVQLRDLSRRLAAEDTCFTATGETFEHALELAFYDLAKKYPRGTVSLLAERGPIDPTPGRQTIGFELDTSTDWEDFKETVFDPVASTVVNISAAIVMIFAPCTIPVLMPLTIAYNSSQTLDQLAEAWTSGTLTAGQGALSLAELGLNLLPLVGRVPLVQTSKLAFGLYQLGDAVGQSLVMTLQAQRQIAALRDRDVAQMAGFYAELIALQKLAHPSDPRVAKKRAALELRAEALRQRTLEVWGDLVAQQAIAMVPVRAAGALEHHRATARLADLRDANLLVDRPGEPPRYEPQLGQIVGDARALDLSTSTRLIDERAAHQEALAGELALDLGVPRDRVSLSSGRALSLTRDGEGFSATIPPGTSPTVAMRAWRARAETLSLEAQLPKRVFLLGADQHARESARANLLDGYVDVYVHASASEMVIELLDRDVRLTPHQLVSYLRKQGLEGHKLRLIACSSGKDFASIAQHIANAHGVEVLAPSDKIWTRENGEIGIGAKHGEHTGEWVPFNPKKAEPDAKDLTPLQKERTTSEPAADLDRPDTRVPVIDRRLRVTDDPDLLAKLQQTLGAKVLLDETLLDGVQLRVSRRRLSLEIEVHVGRRAQVADVLAHARTLADLARYNGVIGQLRRLADAVKGLFGDKPPRFRHGSRGWVTEHELGKLDQLIAARSDFWFGGQVDPVTLDQEIKFLEGRRAYHEEVLWEMSETAARSPAPSGFSIERPDTGQVTREALDAGYRLPGVAESANPDWYYYRSSASAPGTYELARKPDAPFDAPALQARVVGKTFAGLQPAETRPAVELPHDWSAAQVALHLRATPAFGDYARMLESHGLASPAVVDGAIQVMLDRRRLSARAEVTTDGVRHDVKEHFRPRVLAYLLDPSLDPNASFGRMRSMVSQLAPADRGALAETWYLTRNHPEAATHVGLAVERSSGRNAGKLERRTIDAVQGKTAIEVKDVTGPIDHEQFGAYFDMLRRPDDGSEPVIDKLKYVFTNPKGAIANLGFMAKEMSREAFAGRLSIETFDEKGTKHIARSADQADAILKILRGSTQ